MKYFITAGEVSGDLYGGMLMKVIKQNDADAQFFGLGGKTMEAEGLKSFAPIENLSVMGIFEIAKKYGYFMDLLKEAKQLMLKEKADVYIPIDYPGFNIRLATYAHSINVPIAYYIVPQLWAWGKNRAKKLKNFDKLLPIFPFEVDYYKERGLDAETPGCPILDLPIFQEDILPIDKRKQQIAIMAGSRNNELDKHLPILKESVEMLHQKMPNIEFATATTSDSAKERVAAIFPKTAKLNFYEDSRKMMQESIFGIIKSGTSNLESALLGLPFVTFYKMNALTVKIGRVFVNVERYSIVNILNDNETVRELIQNDFTAKNIVEHTLKYINDKDLLKKEQEKLIKLHDLLGGGGTSKRAADIIKNIIISKRG